MEEALYILNGDDSSTKRRMVAEAVRLACPRRRLIQRDNPFELLEDISRLRAEAFAVITDDLMEGEAWALTVVREAVNAGIGEVVIYSETFPLEKLPAGVHLILRKGGQEDPIAIQHELQEYEAHPHAA